MIAPFGHDIYDGRSEKQVDVTGPKMAVHDSVLALAWLVAVLRSAGFQGLSLSEITLRRVGRVGHKPIIFEIHQTRLRPVVLSCTVGVTCIESTGKTVRIVL